MSQENVEIVRQMYDAFGRGDADAALGYFDPGVVVDASHRVDGRVGRGHEELVAILGEWMGIWMNGGKRSRRYGTPAIGCS
jgi:hypothetical protein